MGFAMVFSLKHATKINGSFIKKVLFRGILLIIIGFFLNFCDGFFSRLFEGYGSAAFMDALHNLRFYGILQRMGFIYIVGAFIIMFAKKDAKKILIIAGTMLFAYLFILGFGHGYEYSSENIIFVVDNSIIPDNHLYHRTIDGVRLALDPEGLVSMIPAIAQLLLAFGIGKLFIEHKNDNAEKATLFLFAYSTLLIILGLVLSTFCPLLKRVWSTSFTVLTTGIAFIVIALFSFMTLKKPHEKGFLILKVLGVNALGIFVISNFITYLFKYVPFADHTLQYYLNDILCRICMGNLYFGCFFYALLLLSLI